MKLAQVLVIAAACTFSLAGCETTAKLGDLIRANSASDQSMDSATDTQSYASVPVSGEEAPPTAPTLLGGDPKDDLSLAKQHYREENFGLAEHYFRRAVESRPKDAEAWLGLAAAYDRLKRFDLADRAYDQVIALVGPTAEVLNNQGFSYMLRADYRRARTKLLAARALDPGSPYISNNLAMLEQSARKSKGIKQ